MWILYILRCRIRTWSRVDDQNRNESRMNEMKKQKALLVLIVTCFTLCCACVKDNSTSIPEEPSATEPVVLPTVAPSATIEPPVASNDDEALNAYKAALSELLHNKTLPDGSTCDYDSASNMSDDSFAIYDVDGDGRRELLIVHVAAPVAGQTQYIFDYDADTKQLHLQLSEYPQLTMLNNGTIKADWSHNQGLAGDFWPFSLYKYDSATDSYVLTGMVDAWDKDFAAVDSNGNNYPEEVDVSGVGIVYYIMTNGVYETETPVDVTTFKEWCAANMGDADALELAYSKLTDDNIANLQ